MLHCFIPQPRRTRWCLEDLPVLPMFPLNSRETTSSSLWSSIRRAVMCVVPCIPAPSPWVWDLLYHNTVNHLRNTDKQDCVFLSVWLPFLAVLSQAWLFANAMVSGAAAWWLGRSCVGLYLVSVQNQPDRLVRVVLELSAPPTERDPELSYVGVLS